MQVLAAQTALALSHIDQADQLRAIYRSDVNRRDAKRQDFARELHDAVLNPPAVLSTAAEPLPPQFEAVLEGTIQHIRQVVKGLRKRHPPCRRQAHPAAGLQPGRKSSLDCFR